MIWPTVEYIIIILSISAMAVNIFVFFKLKVYRICSSAVIMVVMTLILLVRGLSSILKLADAVTDVREYLKHIRIFHDISTYFWGIVVVILFFQWHQTYSLLADPKKAL